jgi:hypothetical protein
MSEWWRYRLSDFLMYSSRTWYRLVEQYNHAFWPAHLLALLLGIAVIWLVLSPRPAQGRIISAILAVVWMWVAVGWHLGYFANINWAAAWFAGGFGLESILLLWFGVVRRDLTFDLGKGMGQKVGFAVLLLAVFGYPLVAIGSARGAQQSEVFGMMPDPTSLGTVGVLMLTGRRRWLMAVPLAWCVLAGGMLWALK